MKPLQHKKHTLAKRGLSLLCILALCLGLLPVTALAAGDAPDTLWVGQTQITKSGYWKTNADGTLTADGASESNYNVYYDGNGTLTLNNATIQGGDNVSQQDPQDYGIYASSTTSQSVSLTIKLIGTNTVKGVGGIYITSGGNSALVIQSDSDASKGSLEVSGSGTSGISIVVLNNSSGNPSLTINNASVEASTGRAGYYGVSIASYTTSNPTLSLTVNGGSLTAQAGIRYVSVAGTNSSTSLMVSDGALIKAIPNISVSGASKPTPQAESGSGGIVFEGNSGTVYGDVALDESLIISEDETLTIPEGSILTTNGNLTNNGTIVNKGTMNGDPTGGTGTVVNAPAITTQPDNAIVTVGQTASFTVAASGSEPLSYKWQESNSSGNWADISGATDATYTTGATTTSMSGYQYRCMVSNSAGSVASEVATLTVNEPAPTTYTITADVTPLGAGTATADKNTATAGDAVKLTATANSGYRFTGWTSSNGGNFANTNSASTTFTMPANDVTVTAGFEKYYTITAAADSTEGGTVDGGGDYAAGSSVTLNATANSGYRFVCWMENDQQVSADATYTFPASSNRTLTAKFEKVYNVTVNSTAGGTATADKTTAGVGETVSLTATPNNGYRFTGWTFSDNIIGADVSSKTTSFTMPAGDVTATANFAKIPSFTPSTPPTVSEETTDAIADAQPGETVTVDLSSGSTKLDKEVFETLAGKDVTLVVDLGDGVSWTVKGSDVPEDADFTDIDLGVTMNSDGIPVEVVNAITGERSSVQITLAHDGAFGFTMTLTAPLGTENAGYWANLYHFDEEANAMTFETAAPIGSDGSVSLALSHASQYAIVIDDHNHGIVTLPFTDVSEGDWFYDPVYYVYSQGLMTGTSATTFEPNISLSRAMLVAVLHRLEGNPQASAGDFTDVADGEWYAQAVNWAASVGVVNGFDDGSFQPNTAITREQLAAILCNYAQYKGFDTNASGDLSTYSDAASVSDWAQESVEWMVGSGLLGGYDDNTLRPQGTTTRAEVASVLQRALGNVAGNQ